MIMITSLSFGQSDRRNMNVPTDFESIGFQIDPFGSENKEGLNSVISYSGVDFGWLEYELSIQSILTPKYSDSNNIKLDYIDFMFGPGVLIPISNRLSITPGIHLGYIYRGSNNERSSSLGGFMYGATFKARYWVGRNKGIAIVASSAYDRRPDLQLFRINNRIGLEIRL